MKARISRELSSLKNRLILSILLDRNPYIAIFAFYKHRKSIEHTVIDMYLFICRVFPVIARFRRKENCSLDICEWLWSFIVLPFKHSNLDPQNSRFNLNRSLLAPKSCVNILNGHVNHFFIALVIP